MVGQKTGGRIAGSPNKRTVELTERLAELGCDPLEGLARIAMDPATDVALRARVFADLMPYIYPRRRAMEVSGNLQLSDEADHRASVMAKLFPELMPGAPGERIDND